MILRPKLLPIIVAFVLCLTLSEGQAEKGAKVKFSCASWKKLTIEKVFFRQGKEMEPIRITPGNRTKTYTLTGQKSLELYTKIYPKEEEKEPYYKLIGKVNIPSTYKRCLVFITEREPKKDELPLKLSKIDDSLEVFPRSSFRFVNLTKQSMEVLFSNERNRIKPKGMTSVKFKVGSAGELLPFVILDENKNNIYEDRVFGKRVGRDMIFIVPPASKGGRVKVKLLPQTISAQQTD